MPAKIPKYPARDLEAIPLPAQFFNRLLAEVDDLAEFKTTLFCLAALQQKEGDYRYLRLPEFLSDQNLMGGLAAIDTALPAPKILERSLAMAIDRSTLLKAEIVLSGNRQSYYLLNDEQGRELQRRLQAGEWQPNAANEIQLLPPRPSIYQLYEENIGPLTPLLADMIEDTEASYPRAWIEEAIRYAVERNARNWRYIQKVLEGWRQEGRSHEKHGRHTKRRKRYTDGEWKELIES